MIISDNSTPGPVDGSTPLPRAECVRVAIDALVVQSFAADRSTEETKEMIVDAVCASVLLLERLAVAERAEATMAYLLRELPTRLAEIRNGRPIS